MKVLKLIESGLILEEDFNTSEVREPLIPNANFSFESYGIDLLSGSIDINAPLYKDVVFEIENDFIPSNTSDLGGIRLKRGNQKQEFFEYTNGGATEAIPYLKIVKEGDVYTGYGSSDGESWINKGYVVFPFCEKIGVTVRGSSPYTLNKIKLYKNNYVTIHNILPSNIIKIFDGAEVVLEKQVTEDSIKIVLPYYPFSGTFVIYNDLGSPIVEYFLEDVWGGDEYISAVNVDLLNSEGEPLLLKEYSQLGNLENGIIDDWFIAHNKDGNSITIKIRIAAYSPFYDWVTISKDEGGAPTEYGKEIELELDPDEQAHFWLKVARPFDKDYYGFDFRHNQCEFFLEVI